MLPISVRHVIRFLVLRKGTVRGETKWRGLATAPRTLYVIFRRSDERGLISVSTQESDHKGHETEFKGRI